MVEGARFENPTAPETIGSNLVSSFGSHHLQRRQRHGMNRSNPIGPDSSAQFGHIFIGGLELTLEGDSKTRFWFYSTRRIYCAQLG